MSTLTTIVVDRTEVHSRGQRNRRQWTKYLVFGHRADGSPLSPDGTPVYTFDNLKVGQQDVSVEPFVKNGQVAPESWTVKVPRADRTPKQTRPAGGGDAATPARADVIDKDEVDDLRERVEALEQRMARVMTKLKVEAR